MNGWDMVEIDGREHWRISGNLATFATPMLAATMQPPWPREEPVANPPRDIVDEIDALVDEQMAGGEPETGYDFGNPTFPRCPHCDRHWHGLRITERIAAMYRNGTYDEDYVAAEDDSRVLCEGSEFIGPMQSELQPWSAIVDDGPSPAEGHIITVTVDGRTMTGVVRRVDHVADGSVELPGEVGLWWVEVGQ